jgi:hypothetical protein
MRKTLRTIGSLACLLSLTSIGHAQAKETATGPGIRNQVGFEVTYARPDFWVAPIGDPQYARQYIFGVSGYGDYRPVRSRYLGVEGDFHCIALITSLDRAELTYLVGPRFSYPIRDRYTLYGKALLGFRDLFIQEWQDNEGIPRGMGPAYAAGVGLDFQYNMKWNLRFFEVEVQKWPSYSTNGINPVVISTGFAYRFH